MKGRKHDKPLKFDLPFDEALRRVIRTSPAELAESIEAEKKAKEQQDKKAGEEPETGRLER